MRKTYKLIVCKGFTLIELLVVISIIAILMSIMMPSLQKARQQAKLAICANNQHQLILGVTSYQSDFYDFPPSIQGKIWGTNNVWTQPYRLNYFPKPVYQNDSGFAGGVMSEFLEPYISDAMIFGCPMSPPRKNYSVRSAVSGKELDYQQAYLSGEINYVDASYWQLWNYRGFNSVFNPKKFIGPGKKSKMTLLTSDVLCWNDVAAGLPNMWLSSHRNIKKGSMKARNDVFYAWEDAEKIKPDNINMNAGYSDGHVERFKSSDTYEMRLGSDLKCYIPTKFN
ncbi:MAG: type II secretion system protein [Sedimentisphaeraceae bacterium JB056]